MLRTCAGCLHHHPALLSTLVNTQAPPSPINFGRLALYLSDCPDQQLAAYVLSGIRDGFRIGVFGPVSVHLSSQNHPSCLVCPAAVGSYLSSEQSAGRLLGPLWCSDHVHISHVGLVPKGHQVESWRMIVDLFHSSGRSVNNLIPSDLCSLCYPSVDDTVDYILALGHYTQLIKIDLKNAYRIFPYTGKIDTCWECVGKVVSVLISVCRLASTQPRRYSPLLQIHWHEFLIVEG